MKYGHTSLTADFGAYTFCQHIHIVLLNSFLSMFSANSVVKNTLAGANGPRYDIPGSYGFITERIS